jgi:hypothetical protein
MTQEDRFIVAFVQSDRDQTHPSYNVWVLNCSFEGYFEREADSPKLLETLKR